MNLNTKIQSSEKRCTKCGELKHLWDFYFDKRKGRHEAICKSCKLAYQRERHKQVMNDPNLHHKRLLTQSKYRERYRDRISEKERLKRRKMGISTQRYVNKELLLELYKQGLPIEVIASRCNCVPATVKVYAYRNGIRRGRKKQRICYNCIEFPCFKGIETLSSNFALTCKKYKLRKQKKMDFGELDEDKRLRKLIMERIAWQDAHPKPWYLVSKKSDLYRRNHFK